MNFEREGGDMTTPHTWFKNERTIKAKHAMWLLWTPWGLQLDMKAT